MLIDLDKAREERWAARREAGGDDMTVVIGGESFTLPAELSIAVVEKLTVDSDLVGAAKMLFGDQYEAVSRHNLSVADLTALMEGMAKAQGFQGTGESSASSQP